MLIKLMKYEWKSIWRAAAIINAFTVVVTVLGLFCLYTPFSKSGLTEYNQSFTGPILFSLVLYYVTIIGVSLAASVFVAIRFYKNLYTDEGYMMHVLPVTHRQILLSKLIIHSLFTLFTGLLVFVSVIVLFLPLASLQTSQTLYTLWLEINNVFYEAFGMAPLPLALYFLFIMIIGSISGILMIYCSITIGQTFRKHKVMASILCYVALYFILQTIVSLAMMPQMLTMMVDTMEAASSTFDIGRYVQSTLLIALFSSLISGVIYYIITDYLMGKKLNLD